MSQTLTLSYTPTTIEAPYYGQTQYLDVTSLSNLDEISVIYALNTEDRTVSRAISNDITFIGAAFTFIEEVFFTGTDVNEDAIINATIVMDLCDSFTMDFEIAIDIIRYCPAECTISSPLRRITDDTESHNLIRNELIKNEKPEKSEDPYMEYPFS